MKAEECEFHQQTVSFLGFIVFVTAPLHILTSSSTRFRWKPLAKRIARSNLDYVILSVDGAATLLA